MLARFAEECPAVVAHTGGGRPPALELQLLSTEVDRAGLAGTRDLAARPFGSWDEAFEALAGADVPVLVVLDEFPELAATSPELEGVLPLRD